MLNTCQVYAIQCKKIELEVNLFEEIFRGYSNQMGEGVSFTFKEQIN